MQNKNQHDTGIARATFDVYLIELRAGKDCLGCTNGAVQS